jgi:hypothetical protein
MRRIATGVGALVVLAVGGCGSDDSPDTPVACLEPASAYLRALEAAPGEVRLEGTTRISDCLVEEQGAGAQAQVGETMVAAATELNRDARRDPGGPATEQLGYLVGAVQEGASATGGIHEDLVLRLDTAAQYSGQQDGVLGAGFQRPFNEGYVAGQASG